MNVSLAPHALRTHGRLAAFLMIVGLLWFMPERSAIGQSKAVVVYVEGPDANAARKAVIDGLPAGSTIADARAFRRELARQGQKKPFGRHVDSQAVDRVRRAANAVGAGAVLLVRVRKADPRTALVLIVDPSGTVGADHEIQFRANMSDEDQNELRRSLGQFAAEESTGAGESAEVPPPAAPSSEASQANPTPQAPPSAAPPTEGAVKSQTASPVPVAPDYIRRPGPSDAGAAATSLADIAVAGGVAGRRFEYRNGIAPYSSVFSQAAPALGFHAELFPLAGVENPWGDIGFVGEYLTILSSDFAGIYPTGYGLGLRARVHPGTDPPVILSVGAGYEFLRFGGVDAGGNRLPDVTYRALRPSVDARVPVGRFSTLAGTAVRVTIDPSGISQQFYGSPSGIGFDAHLGTTFIFFPHFEARLIASYTRYSFSFGPPPGTIFGSGNATDELFDVFLGVAYMR